MGFLNILEGCRHSQIQHLVYASSSSVYGANKKIRFSVEDNVDYPISLYAATKKSNELIAHSYSHLYHIPDDRIAIFTIYGHGSSIWRCLFSQKPFSKEKPIDVFNYGKMQRDFTYIDDIVEGVVGTLDRIPQSGENPQTNAPYKLYNIGNNQPIELLHLIEVLETALGKPAIKNLCPSTGDVPITYADVDALIQDIDFQPNTSIEVGVPKLCRMVSLLLSRFKGNTSGGVGDFCA